MKTNSKNTVSAKTVAAATHAATINQIIAESLPLDSQHAQALLFASEQADQSALLQAEKLERKFDEQVRLYRDTHYTPFHRL